MKGAEKWTSARLQVATTGRSLGASRAAAQYHIASWSVLPRKALDVPGKSNNIKYPTGKDHTQMSSLIYSS